jgi:hypothetical protein
MTKKIFTSALFAGDGIHIKSAAVMHIINAARNIISGQSVLTKGHVHHSRFVEQGLWKRSMLIIRA